MLTPDRRLVIVEHVLGAALDERHFSADRLWRDVGIVTVRTVDDVPRLDKRNDIVQLALAVLSVLLGRRITPDDYPKNLDALLDEFARTSGKRSPTLAGPLRRWLEEALDPAAGFETAVEAGEGLRALGISGEHVAIGAPPIIEHMQASTVQTITVPQTQVNYMALTSTVEHTESLAAGRAFRGDRRRHGDSQSCETPPSVWRCSRWPKGWSSVS